MNRTSATVLALTLILGIPATASAQGTRADYERAEKFLPGNMNRLAYGHSIDPRWLGNGDKLWFIAQTRAGRLYQLVDIPTRQIKPLFDHNKLAAALANASGKTVDPASLPIAVDRVADDLSSIDFSAFDVAWRYSIASDSCESRGTPQPAGPEIFTSPDGKWELFASGFNLFLRATGANSSRQLTTDGSFEQPYATEVPGPQQMVREGRTDITWPTHAAWSPDSRTILTWQLDIRGAGQLSFTQATPPDGVRPRTFTYLYPLPGDAAPVARMVVIDRDSGRITPLAIDPLPILYYGSPWPQPQWSRDGSSLLHAHVNRGWTNFTISVIDPETGAARALFNEASTTCMDPGNGLVLREFDGGKQILWRSDRDGYDHLYRYDRQTGALLGQVTKGPWMVLDVLDIDESAGMIYFTAVGREAGRDPYLRHLYRCRFDGSGVELLTPENAEHWVWLRPGGTYFVDLCSQVPGETVTRVRDRNGAAVMELQRADVADLTALGWKAPEYFVLPGRDGKTPIYGCIYRPTNFDPSRNYPVIDEVYSGPHHVQTPRTLAAIFRVHGQSIAELGFIVVYIDGMGTANRSKAYQDVSYKNLVDGGFPDHIAVLKQLAAKYPYMDLDRVGVYGYSAGGYNTAQALLSFGDFYKVGVAASGNYDHRMDKAWWNELWMGYPVTQPYIDQSCITRAPNLKGKLMLAHGELDDNVPPYVAYRLADALMKADKEFEFMIVPNAHHNLTLDKTFIRRRWDFFVKHLLGKEPQQDYVITTLGGSR